MGRETRNENVQWLMVNESEKYIDGQAEISTEKTCKRYKNYV